MIDFLMQWKEKVRTILGAVAHRRRIMLEKSANLHSNLWFVLQGAQEAENNLYLVEQRAKEVEEKVKEAKERAKEIE